MFQTYLGPPAENRWIKALSLLLLGTAVALFKCQLLVTSQTKYLQFILLHTSSPPK